MEENGKKSFSLWKKKDWKDFLP